MRVQHAEQRAAVARALVHVAHLRGVVRELFFRRDDVHAAHHAVGSVGHLLGRAVLAHAVETQVVVDRDGHLVFGVGADLALAVAAAILFLLRDHVSHVDVRVDMRGVLRAAVVVFQDARASRDARDVVAGLQGQLGGGGDVGRGLHVVQGRRRRGAVVGAKRDRAVGLARDAAGEGLVAARDDDVDGGLVVGLVGGAVHARQDGHAAARGADDAARAHVAVDVAHIRALLDRDLGLVFAVVALDHAARAALVHEAQARAAHDAAAALPVLVFDESAVAAVRDVAFAVAGDAAYEVDARPVRGVGALPHLRARVDEDVAAVRAARNRAVRVALGLFGLAGHRGVHVASAPHDAADASA